MYHILKYIPVKFTELPPSAIMACVLDCVKLGDYSWLRLPHLISQSMRWGRAGEDIKMASANPACRLQTATQVCLWGWGVRHCAAWHRAHKNTLHPSDAWGGTAIICQPSQPSRAETDVTIILRRQPSPVLTHESHFKPGLTIINLLSDNRSQLS